MREKLKMFSFIKAMIALFLYALILCTGFGLFFYGCGGGGNPSSTPTSYGDLSFSIDLSHVTGKMVGGKYLLPTISNVQASVSAADLDAQTKNLTNSGGVWSGTLQVRVGKNRSISVQAIDPNSVVVYRECQPVVMDVVEGTNTVNINLCDVSGNVVVNGKVIVSLVWNIDNSCTPNGILAIDSTNIYFVERGSAGGCSGASIKKIPIASGAVTVLASGLNNAFDIETDGTEVFWQEWGSNTIKKISVGGGAVTTIASGLNQPYHLALDASNVYWSEYNGAAIKSVPKAGGATTTLASGLTFPNDVNTDGTDVYWTEGMNAEILKKIPVGGGAVTTLNTGTCNRGSIKFSGSNVYFTQGNVSSCSADYSIRTVPKAGGAETVLMSGITNSPGGMDLDATDIYFTVIGTSPGYADGSLRKVPLIGGTVTTLVTPLNQPAGMRVDNANMYWIDLGTQAGNWTDGVLRKLQK